MRDGFERQAHLVAPALSHRHLGFDLLDDGFHVVAEAVVVRSGEGVEERRRLRRARLALADASGDGRRATPHRPKPESIQQGCLLLGEDGAVVCKSRAFEFAVVVLGRGQRALRPPRAAS